MVVFDLIIIRHKLGSIMMYAFNYRVSLVVSLLLSVLPVAQLVYGADNCRVVEFPDHYEAVCTGDSKRYPENQVLRPESESGAANGADVSRKRQRINDIRSLNAHRFDTVVAQPATEDLKTSRTTDEGDK